MIAMADMQQKQIIPTLVNDKPLVGSGMEKIIAYNVSESFSYVASGSGKVTKVDTTNQLAFLEFDDGRTEVIDLRPTMNAHSSGYYLKSQLQLLLKEGQKFKDGEVIAVDPAYFTTDKGHNAVEYKLGTLANVAMASGDNTLEDSSYISTVFGEKLATKMTKRKDIVLGPNATIQHMVKVGDKIQNGEPLIVYENSFEDDSLNEILKKLGDEFEETIDSLSRNTFRSMVTGEIVDIEIYYTEDLDTLSPSIRKYLNPYLNRMKKVKNIIFNNSSDGLNRIAFNIPVVEKQEGNKVKGVNVEGIIIFFYIEYNDVAGTGDKVAYYGPTKSVIADTLLPEEMPYSESNPDKPLDAVFSPLSIVSRNTMDIPKMLYTNKVLVGAKDKLREMFERG